VFIKTPSNERKQKKAVDWNPRLCFPFMRLKGGGFLRRLRTMVVMVAYRKNLFHVVNLHGEAGSCQ